MRPSFFLFLCGSLLTAACQPVGRVDFDGSRAYYYLQLQCKFGPRVPGSTGHRQMLDFLKKELEKCTSRVKTQTFTAQNPLPQAPVELYNVLATFYPESQQRVLLCAHWDTRPWADKDPDSSKRQDPILGANDGASGTAILLHLAEIIAQHRPKYGVDLVFFDGEDLGEASKPESYALGSQFFAKNSTGYRPEFAILLDMVGDKDLKIYKEEYSNRFAPHTVELVWNKARDLRLDCFVDSLGYAVWDDHIPLLQAGIPCVDIIDFNYPCWHTTADTPDKCSAESLEKVGRLLVALLYD